MASTGVASEEPFAGPTPVSARRTADRDHEKSPAHRWRGRFRVDAAGKLSATAAVAREARWGQALRLVDRRSRWFDDSSLGRQHVAGAWEARVPFDYRLWSFAAVPAFGSAAQSSPPETLRVRFWVADRDPG